LLTPSALPPRTRGSSVFAQIPPRIQSRVALRIRMVSFFRGKINRSKTLPIQILSLETLSRFTSLIPVLAPLLVEHTQNPSLGRSRLNVRSSLSTSPEVSGIAHTSAPTSKSLMGTQPLSPRRPSRCAQSSAASINISLHVPVMRSP
jgi:hypothetical protein